jgi:ribosomal protein S18 acetylase RimI-like enzyme
MIRSLGFRTDVMVLGLGGSQVEDRGGYVVVRTPENPGYWWGNFLLYATPPAPGDAARWEADFTREFPSAGHRAFGVDGGEGEAGDPAAHRALGLTAEVNAVMTTDRLAPAPDPATLPPDTEIRPLAGADDWAQALQLRLAAHDSAHTDDDLRFAERQVAIHRALTEAGHGTWFGAFVAGRLRAGAGVFTNGSGLARYQNVETHPSARRRGLATAVVHRAGTHALHDPHTHTLVIVAEPAYPAIRLYRALNFEETERQVQLHRPPQ